MKKTRLDIYTSDGRIDPDRAFELVRETMKTLTPEEFRMLNSQPFQMRGIPNGVVRTFPDPDPVVEPETAPTKPKGLSSPKKSRLASSSRAKSSQPRSNSGS